MEDREQKYATGQRERGRERKKEREGKKYKFCTGERERALE